MGRRRWKAIDDIAEYLNKRFTIEWDGETPGSDGKYIGYFYKEQPKKPGKNPYNIAHYKMYTNTEDNKAKLRGDIDWMKSKGYLKEVTTEVKPVLEVDIDDLPSVLDNL